MLRFHVTCVLLVALAAATPAVGATARIVYVGPEEGSVRRGAELGLEEVTLQGSFTGHEFELHPATVEELLRGELAEPPTAVVAAVDARELQRLAEHLEPAGVTVLNAAAEGDDLRRQCRRQCRANLLHVIPSERMRATAEAQWRQKHSGAEADDDPETSARNDAETSARHHEKHPGTSARHHVEDHVEARAWHPDFVKYAARDLNKRFRRSQGVAMDDGAWAGWAAVRIVGEAVVRTGDADPGRILDYLRRELEFDGQKGVAHTFHESGQLRQPLLLTSPEGELLGEAPVRGVADVEDLDSLGMESCPRREKTENPEAPGDQR